MMLSATALYAALLGLVFVVLAGLVGRARGEAGVSLGDGDDARLVEAVRRHGNLAEVAPLALILMAVIEINGAAKWWVHTLGLCLLASRIIHPFGISASQMNKPARMIGAGGTFLVLLALAVTAGWQALVAIL